MVLHFHLFSHSRLPAIHLLLEGGVEFLDGFELALQRLHFEKLVVHSEGIFLLTLFELCILFLESLDHVSELFLVLLRFTLFGFVIFD